MNSISTSLDCFPKMIQVAWTLKDRSSLHSFLYLKYTNRIPLPTTQGPSLPLDDPEVRHLAPPFQRQAKLLGDSLVLLGFTGGFPGRLHRDYTNYWNRSWISMLAGGFHFSLNRNALKDLKMEGFLAFSKEVSCLSI